jgi:hypothetical protein
VNSTRDNNRSIASTIRALCSLSRSTSWIPDLEPWSNLLELFEQLVGRKPLVWSAGKRVLHLAQEVQALDGEYREYPLGKPALVPNVVVRADTRIEALEVGQRSMLRRVPGVRPTDDLPRPRQVGQTLRQEGVPEVGGQQFTEPSGMRIVKAKGRCRLR